MKKMNKGLRRCISLVIATIMVLGCTMTAFAYQLPTTGYMVFLIDEESIADGLSSKLITFEANKPVASNMPVFETQKDTTTFTWKAYYIVEDGSWKDAANNGESFSQKYPALYDGTTPKEITTEELKAMNFATADSIEFISVNKTVTPKTCVVKFTDENGKVIDKITVNKYSLLKDAVAAKTATKASTVDTEYTFKEWLFNGKSISATKNVTSSITVKASFSEAVRQYNVTFDKANGEENDEPVKVDYNTTATAPADPEKKSTDSQNFKFLGWSLDGKDVVNPSDVVITEDTTFTALYEASARQYTVTFVDEDGKTPLGTDTVKYGTSYDKVEKPANPTKVANSTHTFEFEKWVVAENNSDITVDDQVTGNIVLKAVYTATALPVIKPIEEKENELPAVKPIEETKIPDDYKPVFEEVRISEEAEETKPVQEATASDTNSTTVSNAESNDTTVVKTETKAESKAAVNNNLAASQANNQANSQIETKSSTETATNIGAKGEVLGVSYKAASNYTPVFVVGGVVVLGGLAGAGFIFKKKRIA